MTNVDMTKNCFRKKYVYLIQHDLLHIIVWPWCDQWSELVFRYIYRQKEFGYWHSSKDLYVTQKIESHTGLKKYKDE